MKTFERLESRYIFTGTLVLLEAMHIGSGEGDERADSLFARSNGIFYIPGSSLRGALRSTIERIAYTLGKNTCLLFDNSSSSQCVTANPKLLEKAKRNDEEWDETKELNFLRNNLCDVCKVFGSTRFASKIKITDLYPTGNNNPQSIIRHGVGIDRDTETAAQGALFDIEVVEKGHRFDFELIAENLDGKDEWGLLCIGLKEMMRDQKEGGAFYVGANSTSGLGRCQLTNLEIKYFDEGDNNYKLRDFLRDNKLGPIRGEEAIKFVKGKIEDYLK